ncbi:predicted protein [Uncinocarpus reesii 1704]|uniref:PHD-type domain-containing protein n=1 Tax=Uncinocarpus reesii (strain UAMH 1704) TaxID=336963 RepID=C4JTN7_UNCRE|nr:uncharacterized protein UREG_05826 [Uncinocarpus reesii 1704]EEP80984.1 predicted protein [Uncinocarpus reesii 1704]
MVSRKRAREETEEHAGSVADSDTTQHGGLLQQLRSMWEFANLGQYIFTFGKAMKIDEDFDIEPCRGVGFGDGVSKTRALGEIAGDWLVASQIRLVTSWFVQLTAWTLWNPDRLREKMPEQKDTEQTEWRCEELGYDRDERLYYILDDNRLYRRTNPPIPTPKPAKPKVNSKRGRAAARAAKRRKQAESDVKSEDEEQVNGDLEYKWECIAVTLADYQALIEKFRKTKDADEKILRDRLIEEVLPTIEKLEEAQQKEIQRREKELLNLQKMATAKRSSRLADKQERERQELAAAEELKKREAERIAAKKEHQLKEKIEKERLYRLMTREQRLKDREEKRRLQEQHLAEMEAQAKMLETGEARLSERQLKAMMEKGKQDLENLQAEEPWTFDCSVCGIHGENLDDGSHSVACENCNVWQHSQCLGIPKEEAERDDFHFVCADCQRRIEDAKRPKIPPLKFRIPTSTSPPSAPAAKSNGEKQKQHLGEESPVKKPKKPHPIPPGQAAGMSVPGVQTSFHTNAPASYPQSTYPSAAPVAANIPPAAHIQRQPMKNGTFYPPIQPQQPPPATAQLNRSMQPGQHPEPQLKFIQHYPPPTVPHSTSTSFNSQRPSSSYSTQSTYPSPIQNRPSMSPTQGNRDVGPLAGFRASATQNGPMPSTPFSHNVASSPYLNQTPSASFSTPHASFVHTPPPNYSQPISMSGLSPTKQSPPRAPPTFSPNVGNTAVLPPVQKLQPSPKLMGRSSPDAPVPTPVKSMTLEQEDWRRREMEYPTQNMSPQLGPVNSSTTRPQAPHPTQLIPQPTSTAANGLFHGAKPQ